MILYQFLWYDEYILLSEKEITKIIKEREQKILNQLKERQVVCVNYKLLFDSQINGSKYLNVNKTGISLCCNGHRTNVYENKNHEKLIWKFAKDVDDIIPKEGIRKKWRLIICKRRM